MARWLFICARTGLCHREPTQFPQIERQILNRRRNQPGKRGRGQRDNNSCVVALEAGVSYTKQKLHKAAYFRELSTIDPALGSDFGFCFHRKLGLSWVLRPPR
jgi:hypothetical protein